MSSTTNQSFQNCPSCGWFFIALICCLHAIVCTSNTDPEAGGVKFDTSIIGSNPTWTWLRGPLSQENGSERTKQTRNCKLFNSDLVLLTLPSPHPVVVNPILATRKSSSLLQIVKGMLYIFSKAEKICLFRSFSPDKNWPNSQKCWRYRAESHQHCWRNDFCLYNRIKLPASSEHSYVQFGPCLVRLTGRKRLQSLFSFKLAQGRWYYLWQTIVHFIPGACKPLPPEYQILSLTIFLTIFPLASRKAIKVYLRFQCNFFGIFFLLK